MTIEVTMTHHFSGHFPNKPGLTGYLLYLCSESTVYIFVAKFHHKISNNRLI